MSRLRKLAGTVGLISRTLARMRRGQIGGTIPLTTTPGQPISLSPGRQITDPDEAEALGLTADARRMRREQSQ